jgi:hypothetical protein
LHENKNVLGVVTRMQQQSTQSLRQSGVKFIKNIPWGTHISGFYQTKKDLINMLLPYFEIGLKNNEYCVWVVSEPITTIDAETALREAIPDYQLGQMEILAHWEWYLKYSNFDGRSVLNSWIEKQQFALANGYDGIRVSGDTSWLNKKYYKAFMEYEALIQKKIDSLQLIALCTYQLDQCDFYEVINIINNHQFTFIESQEDLKHLSNISKYDRLNIAEKMAVSFADEIRNPLTSVRGFLQLLQDKQEFKTQKNNFSFMIDELDRANKIISQYVTLTAKTETSHMDKE